MNLNSEISNQEQFLLASLCWSWLSPTDPSPTPKSGIIRQASSLLVVIEVESNGYCFISIFILFFEKANNINS